MVQIKKGCALKLIIILIVSILGWWYFTQARNTDRREHDIVLSNDESVFAEYNHSYKKSFGFPHVFGWGGGEDHYQLKVKVNSKVIEWDGVFQPLIFNKWKEFFYLAVFEKTWSFTSRRFLFFKLVDNKWVPVQRGEFPKRIALQNLWLEVGRSPDDLRIDTNAFGETFNKRLWYYIETGEHPTFLPENISEQSWEFYERYLAPSYEDNVKAIEEEISKQDQKKKPEKK